MPRRFVTGFRFLFGRHGRPREIARQDRSPQKSRAILFERSIPSIGQPVNRLRRIDTSLGNSSLSIVAATKAPKKPDENKEARPRCRERYTHILSTAFLNTPPAFRIVLVATRITMAAYRIGLTENYAISASFLASSVA